MKKIIILALAFIFTASVCVAGTTQPKTKETTGKSNTLNMVTSDAKKKDETKEMTGKVKMVTLADPVKGKKPEVTIINEKSNEKTFLIKGTTTIYDLNSRAITFDKLKADEKVDIKYTTTKEGVREAVSIRLLS
ncbi:MAG: hypothetical protein ACMUHX_08245 [bacterium]